MIHNTIDTHQSNFTWDTVEIESRKEIDSLISAFAIPYWIASLLVQRGLFSDLEVKNFFNPSGQELHDPFLLSDMKEAVKLLFHTVEQKQKIMVYGDYDVDGTTAVSMISDFLRELETEHINYIPDRFDEGYGVSMKGIQTAVDEKCNLIITLDCGIRAIEPIAKAKEMGIKVIVCDHHEPGPELPNAYAILNPKKVNCKYPFKELSGAGVGFKLIQAFGQEQGWEWEDTKHHLDLLAISIAADMVGIQGENRYLVSCGLKLLNSSKRRLGIDLLLEKAKRKDQELKLSDLVFALAPRINAAGRIGSATAAVTVLTKHGDKEEKLEAIELIESYNTKRKQLDQQTKEEALDQIKLSNNHGLSHSTVVHSSTWHKGVVGIVASRLIDAYYRPSVVLAEKDGLLTGSVRSIKGIDVHSALENCKSVLIKFGGHVMAAGLLLEKKNLEEFKHLFDSAIKKQSEKLLTPSIKIHAEVDLDQWTDKTFRIIERMEPFGPGNARPTFLAKDVIIESAPSFMGKDRSHVRLKLRQTDISNKNFDAVYFNAAKHCKPLKQFSKIDVVYVMERNNWKGKSSVQLRIKDLLLKE